MYDAKNCTNCPLCSMCHNSKYNKIIKANHNLFTRQAKAREHLKTEVGIYHRKRRRHDAEPVFAQIKHNKNFKRFNLRGKVKIKIETDRLALTHNLKKIAA